MEYAKFKKLASSQENASVDFKIDCPAFASPQMSAKAELAKDICAMANNGNVASYLIIGVSDDGKRFKSVRNKKLTDDNLQSFAKEAVYPPPKVKLIRKRWAKGDKRHVSKDFVIIQIGPQSRRAFRLARDFISHTERVCYRRNEVWIRRGATSDLATPEEISLLVKGRPPASPDKLHPNVQYDRLLRSDQYRFVVNDLRKCVSEVGGTGHEERLVVPIRKLRFVWRFCVLPQLTEQFAVWGTVASRWAYEHGFLIISLGTVATRAFHSPVRMHFEDDWGYFTVYDLPNPLIPNPRVHFSVPERHFPVNTDPWRFVTMTLRRIKDTVRLRHDLLGLFGFLDSNDDAYEQIKAARDTVNNNTRRWIRQGWLFPTGRYYSGGSPKRSELGSNELLSKRYGNKVLRRERPKVLLREIQEVLQLSSGQSGFPKKKEAKLAVAADGRFRHS